MTLQNDVAALATQADGIISPNKPLIFKDMYALAFPSSFYIHLHLMMTNSVHNL